MGKSECYQPGFLVFTSWEARMCLGCTVYRDVLTRVSSLIAPLARDLSPLQCHIKESQTVQPRSLWKIQHRAQVGLWAGGTSRARQQAPAA